MRLFYLIYMFMKKFSKLITESKQKSDNYRHPAISDEDWNKVQPLIDLLQSDIYTENTRKRLSDLISCMNTDSMIHWQRNIKNEESFEDFFKLFKINSDEDEIKDCIRDLIDNSDELYEDSNDNTGEFKIIMKGFRQKSIEELKEDIKDSFSKLGMIDNTDFYFLIEVERMISLRGTRLTSGLSDLRLPKTLYNGRPADIDAWFELNGIISERGEKEEKMSINNIKSISLFIYNPDTKIK